MPRDTKSLSQARYSQFAAGYVSSETHAHGSDLDRLLAITRPQKRWRALDIATGGGHTALKFAPHVAHVIASDLTPRMLESARRFITSQGVDNVSFRQADAENLPFDRAQFDLVTCRIAPHHFPDAQRFLCECARVLKPGGALMLQDHLLPYDDGAARYIDAFERLRDPSHNRAFNQAEWTQLCARAGLEVEYSERYRKTHDFLSWARRQGPDADTIARLIDLMRSAPPIARDWMNPQRWGSQEATFENRHSLIRARLR
ncbi:MAG: methyltransferase domain-containing protein [Chloroflexi bacterium]|nr:methyltransferase domain-containing protein [Chloroflexota bacterium]MCY3583506.1 methyltransferase domain-containing protein [Chloroflexota bacterium]MCY3716181.1 methyltransferase domain-containing protein [Chloroflexota bacterium]MDE2650864.1 methyltransferase domain-containing protein [Chloroflexota bacterium]MXV94216.1 methyltransferase domain-containing protein [Chloroflexota bacterium]